jgi:hypothetical protein
MGEHTALFARFTGKGSCVLSQAGSGLKLRSEWEGLSSLPQSERQEILAGVFCT